MRLSLPYPARVRLVRRSQVDVFPKLGCGDGYFPVSQFTTGTYDSLVSNVRFCGIRWHGRLHAQTAE